jgi:hypothetical protein
MIWACFSHLGIANVIHLPLQNSFTRAFFVEKSLDNFEETLAHSRPSLRASGTFLHLDTAAPHRAPEHFESFGITKPPYPPYSLDLAPCDFWLFGMFKRQLEGDSFGNDRELLSKVNEILHNIRPAEFHPVFDE